MMYNKNEAAIVIDRRLTNYIGRIRAHLLLAIQTATIVFLFDYNKLK